MPANTSQRSVTPTTLPRGGGGLHSLRAAVLAISLGALAFPATSGATFQATFFGGAGAEPAVTNTSTSSFFFNWTANADHSRYCITVYRPSPGLNRGCIPSGSTYYTLGGSGQFSQTETGLPDGTLVGVYPSEYLASTGIYPCSGSHCSSSTLIDLNQPQLTVYAAGTAIATNNPQIPMHIDYFDYLSHPWFAGGNNAAVFVCQRRDRPCNNSDPHNYTPQCSVVNATRFSSPGTNKTNSFDCMYDFTSQPDGPVYLCATAADQSIPDPDPNASEPSNPPTHPNQSINPATSQPWTAANANLANSSCGSVILDRGPPSINATASDTSPTTGDLVNFSASGSDGLSGLSGPFTWDFGDNTQNKQGANIAHTYTSPGTYQVVLTGHDGAGNQGSDTLTIVVTNSSGGTGDEGTVINNPPNNDTIGGDGGVQKTSVGGLRVVAPKKQKVGTKLIRLALIASKAGAFQAVLMKRARIFSKGAGVIPRAGTFGFKLKLPRNLKPGFYKLRITFIPDGSRSGATKTLTIRFIARRRGRVAQVSLAGPPGPVNVDAGPGLAPGYGR